MWFLTTGVLWHTAETVWLPDSAWHKTSSESNINTSLRSFSLTWHMVTQKGISLWPLSAFAAFIVSWHRFHIQFFSLPPSSHNISPLCTGNSVLATCLPPLILPSWSINELEVPLAIALLLEEASVMPRTNFGENLIGFKTTMIKPEMHFKYF